MRKFLLMLCAVCSLTYAQAQTAPTTSDYLTLTVGEDVTTLKPGEDTEEFYVTVALNGGEEDRFYTGFQMTVILPDGIEPLYELSEGEYNWYVYLETNPNIQSDIFPGTKVGSGKNAYWTYSHMISSNFKREDNKNKLIIGCVSPTNTNLKAHSGDLLSFYVKATPFAKPGDLEIKLENVKLITTDAVGYVPTAEMKCNVNVSTTAQAQISISSAKWATCILPFATALPTGVKAFTSSEYSDDKVVLTPANSIEAYKPYVLYSENVVNETVNGMVDATLYPEDGVVTEGNLCGAIVSQSIGENNYVLQDKGDGAKFYAVDPTKPITMSAGKCWMSLPSTAAYVRIVINEPTGIDDVESYNATDNVIYTLQGSKADNTESGQIYIKNGKKQIMK